jgi:molybdate transport system permease protein
VPMTAPGIAAGMVLGFARSLGEFGATITFAGNYPGTTQTMPLLTYVELNRDPQTAYALSLLMLVISLLILALLRERWLGRGVLP